MPTVKQAKAVAIMAKQGGQITGKQLHEIGYGKSAAKTPAKIRQSKTVQQLLAKALKKHKLTLDKAVKPIAEALEAEKMDNFTGEVSPDHNVRLKASAAALKLINPQPTKVIVENAANEPVNSENLAKALKNNDTVEMQRVIFSKSDEQSETAKL